MFALCQSVRAKPIFLTPVGFLWYTFSSHLFFICFFSLPLIVYCLQWTATHGLRWLPCTPRWSSASHVRRLKWARLWRRLWGLLKTLCSLPSPESKTESRDRACSQLFDLFFFINIYNEEVLNVTPVLHKCTDTNSMWAPSTATWSHEIEDIYLHWRHRVLFVSADKCTSILTQTGCTVVSTTEIWETAVLPLGLVCFIPPRWGRVDVQCVVIVSMM